MNSIQNNVLMSNIRYNNQVAFKGGKLNLLDAAKGGKFPSLITESVPSYKPNLQRTREEFVNQIANRLEQLENEVGKALKSITDRFNKKEITAEEAEMMINNDLKDFLQGLNNEDMEKADEAIKLLKKGNEIAQDTYDLVDAWAERAKNQPNYSEILQKIYDYLSKLICNSKCGEDVNKNEVIKGEIENLIGG